jgi:uncharacterized protein YjbI with pentapeptide repeats
MSQMNRRQVTGLFLLIGFLLLAGCGSSVNSPSAIDPAREGHAPGWLPAGHAAAAHADATVCTNCHGSDYSGGISTVACTQCHLGNALNIHPLDWDDLVGTKHAGFVKSNGNSACANVNCHGADLAGVNGSGPSCTSCHLGGLNSVHPLDWDDAVATKHAGYVKSNGNSACANVVCHGAELTGVNGSGPSCTSCHIGGVASFHPVDWGTLTYANHPSYVAANGTTSCSNVACHGADLTGVAGSGPSCTSCHIGGPVSVHPAEWDGDLLQHALYVGTHGISSCANVVCHGPQLQGVFLSGPSCFTCHSFPIPIQ